MATMDEQETTVTGTRADEHVYIYTANLVHLRKLRNDTRVQEIDGGEDWGRFQVPTEIYDPLKGFKRNRKPLTEDQRAAAGERLRKARAARA